MPATDALQPPLSPAERAVVKSYGRWTRFVESDLLDPADDGDVYQGKQILEGLAQHSG